MWFIFSICTALAWGAANLFYKRGSDPSDKFSHLKIVTMVGLVMVIHAISYMIIKDIQFDSFDMIRYLPVSMMYILSMSIAYFVFPHITLSISIPLHNLSGVVSAILLFFFSPRKMLPIDIVVIINV